MNVPKIILLIGSNQHWLDQTITMLEKSEHIVLFAHNAIEGFFIAQCDLPDLIICEFALPDMSGIDFCQLIRSDKELCEVPLILVNENQEDADRVMKELQEGVNDYLTVCCDLGLSWENPKWLPGRKEPEPYLELSYQILFQRQHRLTEIMKETTGLINALNSEYSLNGFGNKQNQELEANLDKRIEQGMNIIDGLTCLLNEQSNSLITLAEALEVEEFNIPYNVVKYQEETFRDETFHNETFRDESNYDPTNFFQTGVVNA